MRIAIAAPSITPAIDGVADYSLKLGRCLQARGHEVLVLGLNDFHGEGRAMDELEPGFARLNLRTGTPIEERLGLAGERLAKFRPEALSVQYYWRGFWAGRQHSRIASFLKAATPGARRNIMFHETWEEVGTSTRLPCWLRSTLVAVTMRRFVSRAGISAHFTNTPLYRRHLQRLLINARVLPIPSNIAAGPRSEAGLARAWELLRSLHPALPSREETFVAVMFGRIQPDLDPAPVIAGLMRRWRASAKPVSVLLSIGKTSYDDKGWLRIAGQAGQSGFITLKAGIQPADLVSDLIACGDTGAVTTRGELLEKSSSFAALRDHGLAIIGPDGNLANEGTDGAPPADPWNTLCEEYLRAMSPR